MIGQSNAAKEVFRAVLWPLRPPGASVIDAKFQTTLQSHFPFSQA